MLNNTLSTQVAIVGAGPAGAVAASILVQKGHKVTVLEQQSFPRFSIGESLLPQSMAFLEEAGMLPDIEQEDGFQFKDGAAFRLGERYTTFDFTDKFSPGHGTTFQVQRAQFDKILADRAEKNGAEIKYQCSVHKVVEMDEGIEIHFTDQNNHQEHVLQAEYLLDASGFGRVLPRLLALETPADFPVRESYFGHIQDNISDPDFDRNKILITVNPNCNDIWYWLIPFGNGKCSVGVVGKPEQFENVGTENSDVLWSLVNEAPELAQLLKDAKAITPIQNIRGYSANVKSLYGSRYALLGNAAEFLDPVFSSGVTIAVKSAHLAAHVVDKKLKGEEADWEQDFSIPLKKGVETFKVFVKGWYEGSFQKVIFHEAANPNVKRMISSILAGYAWDENNPYVAASQRRLDVLAELCS